MHDTVAFGENGEQPGTRGLLYGIDALLQPEWIKVYDLPRNNGLAVFRRPEIVPNWHSVVLPWSNPLKRAESMLTLTDAPWIAAKASDPHHPQGKEETHAVNQGGCVVSDCHTGGAAGRAGGGQHDRVSVLNARMWNYHRSWWRLSSRLLAASSASGHPDNTGALIALISSLVVNFPGGIDGNVQHPHAGEAQDCNEGHAGQH